MDIDTISKLCDQSNYVIVTHKPSAKKYIVTKNSSTGLIGVNPLENLGNSFRQAILEDYNEQDFGDEFVFEDISNYPLWLEEIIKSRKSSKHSKDKASKSDKHFDPLEIAVEDNLPILLVGETGTGKTTKIRELAKKHNKTLIRVNLNGQTEASDLVGKYAPNTQHFDWVNGILTQAMIDGDWIVFDEINAALPEVLFVLQPLLDDDRYIRLPEKDGEIITPHEDFRFFATMNPPRGYAGVKPLNKALLSRFALVEQYNFLPAEEEAQLAVDKTGVNLETAKQIVYMAQRLRKAYVNNDITFCFSTREVLACGYLISKGVNSDKAMEQTVLNKLDPDDRSYLFNHNIIENVKTGIQDLDSLTNQLMQTSQTLQEVKEKLNNTIEENKQKELIAKDLNQKIADASVEIARQTVTVNTTKYEI